MSEKQPPMTPEQWQRAIEGWALLVQVFKEKLAREPQPQQRKRRKPRRKR